MHAWGIFSATKKELIKFSRKNVYYLGLYANFSAKFGSRYEAHSCLLIFHLLWPQKSSPKVHKVWKETPCHVKKSIDLHLIKISAWISFDVIGNEGLCTVNLHESTFAF